MISFNWMRDQMIDLRDTRIDHHLRVFGHGHRAFKHLGDEFLAPGSCRAHELRVRPESSLFDNLIE